MLYPCIFCIAQLIDRFVLCVCDLFDETIHNILLLNITEVLSVGGGALLSVGGGALLSVGVWSS